MDSARNLGVNRGNAGKGRPKGSPNKLTLEFRDTVRKLLEDNRENVSIWLDQVAAEDPDKALRHITALAEYAAPKLARTEHVGDANAPLTINAINMTPEEFAKHAANIAARL